MKRCGSCKEELDLSMFGRDKRTKDGLVYRCKPCDRIATAKWREANREAHNQMSRDWAAKNKERHAENSARYNKEHRGRRTASEGLRRANKNQATPSWFDKSEVEEIYSIAKERNLTVDHIVPLVSKFVCGLHVQDNLRCISNKLNAHKGNRYWPDMAGGY